MCVVLVDEVCQYVLGPLDTPRLCEFDWVMVCGLVGQRILETFWRDGFYGDVNRNSALSTGKLQFNVLLNFKLIFCFQDGLSAAGGLAQNYHGSNEDEYTQSLTLARKSEYSNLFQAVL